MAINWRTQEIGGKQITHWAHWKGHDVHALADLRERSPVQRLGNEPRVLVYRVGKRLLAVRAYGKEVPGLFDILRDTVQARRALIEMPVAKIHDPREGDTIITLWKEKTRELSAFLRSPEYSTEKKEEACLRAIRRVAKLNAAGFLHGDFKANNALIGPSHHVQLVDFNRLRRVRESISPRDDENILGVAEEMARHVHGEEKGQSPQAQLRRMNFVARILAAYDEHLAQETNKLAGKN